MQQGKIGIVKIFLQHGADPKLKKDSEVLNKKDLKNLLKECKLLSIKKSLEDNHPDVSTKIAKKDYDSVFKTYGFEDIGGIEQDYQEIVELSGADSSCSIS